jgi:hypothetical protein
MRISPTSKRGMGDVLENSRRVEHYLKLIDTDLLDQNSLLLETDSLNFVISNLRGKMNFKAEMIE